MTTSVTVPASATDDAAKTAEAAAKVAAAEAALKNQQPAASTPAAPQRPDNVPEKFWDATKGAVNTEALLKSYTELEKSRSQATPPKTGETDPQNLSKEQQANLSKVDMAALSSEIEANGELSTQSYESLEKLGFDRAFVDQVVTTMKNDAAATANSIKETVGGADAYSAMLQWASTNLTAAERNAFNSALGDVESAKIAVAGLNAKYRAANPQLLTGNGGHGGNSGGFASRAEWLAAVNSADYKTSESFRQQVAAKALRSKF